jgi:uncharacterized protein (TIGR02597 family)
MGDTILYPETPLTIRNGNNVANATIFRSSGEVLMSNLTIPLYTESDNKRDAFIALPRPVDTTLSQLNIWESGAFMASSGGLAFQLRDLLLIFDNAQSSINKSSAAIYYHNGTNWLAAGDSAGTIRDNDVIPAGAGFIIRKYQTATGTTSLWQNTPAY